VVRLHPAAVLLWCLGLVALIIRLVIFPSSSASSSSSPPPYAAAVLLILGMYAMTERTAISSSLTIPLRSMSAATNRS
jgi:hypothetical protein